MDDKDLIGRYGGDLKSRQLPSTSVVVHEEHVADNTDAIYELAEERHSAEHARQAARARKVIGRLQGEGLAIVLVIICVSMWISSRYFLTRGNILTALATISILGIMAMAETLLVIAGEIDISIGSVMAATSVLVGLMVAAGINVWAAVALGLLAAGIVGTLNGIITVYLKVNSLITTLGTYSIMLGIAYAIDTSSFVPVTGDGFEVLGTGHIASVPVPVFVFVGIWLVTAAIARFTALGRHIYATGDNYDAAVRSGIQANALRVGLFVAVSLSAGLAGIIVTSELGNSAPQIGTPYLLSVITAVFLGGASLAGGRGRMFGTLIAVLILGVLQNGFALLQFSTYLEDTVLGTLLILAVLTDRIVRRAEK